jgi:hypothetical protein
VELFYKDILDRHIGEPAAIIAHGPSLKPYMDTFKQLQHNNELIVFECNDWFNFFDTAPTYWLFANNEQRIDHGIKNMGMWNTYQHPQNIIQAPDTTILYADSVDFSDKDFVRERLIPDFLAYDQRHFKAHRCMDILKNFKAYVTKEKNLNYRDYGNNSAMWQSPRAQGGAGFSGGLSGGPTGNGQCCNQIIPGRLTIQEKLQEITGYSEHYSTGDSATLHMISFAIIMGCNPIYVAGMDLDYALGYAADNDELKRLYKFVQHNTDWQTTQFNMRNDLKVINESAKVRDIKIINLAKNAWYNELDKGDFFV